MRLYCHFCHKSVTNTLEADAVCRAILCCPECIQDGKILIPDRPMLDRLAAHIHHRWCRWMENLFTGCKITPGGTATMPQPLFDRLALLSGRQYAELTTEEQSYPKNEALGVLQALEPGSRPPRNTDDDMGWSPDGKPIAIGAEAGAEHEAIINDPNATPVLLVAENETGMGVRVYGDPSEKVHELLVHIAATYRLTLDALAEQQRARH